MPVILNKPVEMYQTYIIVPQDYVEKIANDLQNLGVLHITKAGKEALEEYERLLAKINSIQDKMNKIASMLKGKVVDVTISLSELQQLTIDYIEEDVNDMYRKISSYDERLKKLKNELSQVMEYINLLKVFPQTMKLSNILFKGKYITTLIVKGKKSAIEKVYKSLQGIHIYHQAFLKEEVIALLIVPKDLEEKVKETTIAHGIKIIELPSYLSRFSLVKDAVEYLGEKRQQLSTELTEVENNLKNYINSIAKDFSKYRVIIDNIYERIKALSLLYKSKYLYLIKGWLPKIHVDKVKNYVESTNIPMYIEFREPDSNEEPPTLLNNPPIVRFFEPLVKFMGIPNYREWDPTPIIAYSFSLFYGIMLGDLGYAIAIILAAYLILDKFVVDPTNRDYVYFKKSIIVSSIVGSIIGFLSGTLLGNTLELIGVKYSFTDVFTNPLKFLTLSLIIGLIHVNIAHAISLVKNYKLKNTGDVISEIGIFVSEIFGIPYILYKMLNTPLPYIPSSYYDYFLWGAIIGVLIIIAGTIKSLGVLGLLMWIFNVTGLLGDVLSYSRIAGVGLATIYLAQSFNLMGAMTYNGVINMLGSPIGIVVGGIAAAIIIVLGHLINMALSALGSFIHSLRLCFVEFLSKFYEGTGYPFNPLKLVIKKRIVYE